MNTKTFFAATFAATIALAATAIPTVASAAPATIDTDIKVAVVRTADLNLASDEGQATLNTRIVGAVNRVCGAPLGTISLEERVAINTCRNNARRAALAAAKSQEDQMLAQR
ncbi:UrcA family protein [Novosphingobium sp.]|uniref:UrcA family protein n=1 Tax=Novosphingobium sp. TaxID=1874826 RepID=UPI003BAAE285